MTDAELALAGVCPICGRDGWRALGKHVVKAHGVLARDFKEQVGLPWSVGLDAPDVTARSREVAVLRDAAAVMAGSPTNRATLSPAGRAGRATGARRAAPSRRKIPADAGPWIQSRLDAGDLLREIAAGLGCTVSAVSMFMSAFRATKSAPPASE